MHILVTADTIGGVWTYARELVTGLARRGVRITLVSFGEIPNQEQTEWMEGLRNFDFHPTAFPLEWMHNVESDLQASQEFLQSLIYEVKPDLLHLNQFYYGAIAADVPRLVVAHSDVISWWIAVHGHEPPPTKWLDWYRDVITRGIQAANAVVAPSSWMLETIIEVYGKPASSCVIYNGREPNLFNPHMSKEEFVLTVGRLWDSGKQVTLLCEQDPPMDVYIAGSEQHPDNVLRVESPSLLGTAALPRLHFQGAQNAGQLRQLYGRAAIYAATSRYEPFGLAPVEAAFSRCALVANDIPTFRELWGDAALYFSRNDAAGLLHTLEQLKNNSGLRREYSNRAYQRARLHFTADQMAGSYLHLYQSLISATALAA